MKQTVFLLSLGIVILVLLPFSTTYALTENELNQVEELLNFSNPNYVYNKTYVDDFIKRHPVSTEQAMEAAARIIDLWEKSNHICDDKTPAMNATTTC